MVKVARFHCPHCGHLNGIEVEPGMKILKTYQCKACGQKIKTPEGQHCIICAYTDTKCPEARKEEFADGE